MNMFMTMDNNVNIWWLKRRICNKKT